MSDLIDFESPSTSGSMASDHPPLIPSPESLPNDATTKSLDEKTISRQDTSDPLILATGVEKSCRRISDENNPFDVMMKKVVDYERNRDDPFENVVAMSVEVDNPCSPKRPRRYSAIKDDDIDMSIITDLNDTNLIDDIKCMPKIILSVPADDFSKSINDSFSKNSTVKSFRPRISSPIDPYLSPRKSPDLKPRRSLSVTDSLRTSLFGEDNTLHSAHSSMFEDPLNIAFRKFSLKSNASSNVSLNNQSNSSSLSKKCERLSSDSSVFSGSGVSNLSSIPNDSASKLRLGSENSVLSGISNLSIIPKSNASYCDSSSMLSNGTINRGFLASNSQLNSTSSSVSEKNPSDQSDLIKKFYAIKSRMSANSLDPTKPEIKEKSSQLTKSMTQQKKPSKPKLPEKLVDLTNNSNSALSNSESVGDIIGKEARAIAQKIESVEDWRLTTNKDLSASDDDNLNLSKTRLNFDDLPSSDEEVIGNLIQLPLSPVNKFLPNETSAAHVQCKISPKSQIKALESEFIDSEDTEKKAKAATLLLEIEKLVQDKKNPDAQKVMQDLQELLGVKCDSNAEILKMCLQNSNNQRKKNENTVRSPSNNNNKKPHGSNHKNQSSSSKNSNQSLNESYELKPRKSIGNSSSQKLPTKELVKKTPPRSSRSRTIKTLDDSNDDEKLLEVLDCQKESISHKKSKDFHKRLSTVLPNEVQKINKVSESSAENCEPRRSISNLQRSASALYKSFSSQNLNKSHSKLLNPSPLRRSLSTGRSNLTQIRAKLLDAPISKTAGSNTSRQLVVMSKRFPSDPGFMNPDENKENRSPNSNEYYKDSSQERSRPAVDAVVARIRRKPSVETVTKKGPLKAVMPLGNMQKKIGNNFGSMVTPPKTDMPHIACSTPNSSGGKKPKPTASSTPNTTPITTDVFRSQRILTEKHFNHQQKSNAPSNSLPVSLNTGSQKKVSTKRESQRLVKTLSPQKRERALTPKKYGENAENSKLPRYSPRPVKVRNFSLSDIKTAKSPPNVHAATKIPMEKNLHRHSFLSPLKNCNNIAHTSIPMGAMSKRGKPSPFQLSTEKENYV